MAWLSRFLEVEKKEAPAKTPVTLFRDAAEHLRCGRYAEAVECHRALTELEPDQPMHLVRLGASLSRMGSRFSSRDAYRRACTEYLNQGNLAKASAACRLALEATPEDAHLGEILARLTARRLALYRPPPATPLGGGPYDEDTPLESHRPGLVAPEGPKACAPDARKPTPPSRGERTVPWQDADDDAASFETTVRIQKTRHTESSRRADGTCACGGCSCRAGL